MGHELLQLAILVVELLQAPQLTYTPCSFFLR